MNLLSPSLPTSLQLPFPLSSDCVFVWLKHSKVAVEIRASFSEIGREQPLYPLRSLQAGSTQDLNSDERVATFSAFKREF